MDASQSDGKLTKSTTSWLKTIFLNTQKTHEDGISHLHMSKNHVHSSVKSFIAFRWKLFLSLKNSHGKPLKRLSPHLGSSEMYRKSQPSSAMAASDEVKFYRTMSHGLSFKPIVHWRLGSSPLSWMCICHGLLSLSKQSLQTCLWSISRVNMWRMIRFQSIPHAWHLDHLQQHLFTRHLWQVQSDRSGQMRRTSGRTRTCLVRIQKNSKTI